MENIIISIITTIIGLAFLSWGIYQIKTGKMVAKHAKYPIDEPRQVGILFIAISLVAFWFAISSGISLILSNFNPYTLTYIPLFCISLFILAITIYGFKNHRIFGIKNTQKIAKYTKKYYILVNFSLILCAFAVIILNIFSSNLSLFINFVLIIIIFVTALTAITPMLLIKSKSTQKNE